MALRRKKRRRDRQQRLRTQRDQRKRRRKRGLPSARELDSDIVLFEHPFSNMKRDELQQAMLKFSEDAAAKLPCLQAEVLDAAKVLLPTYFLASMAMQATFVGMNDAGDIVQSKSKYEKKLQQYHLELAQGIFLTIPPGDLRDTTCHPHGLQKFSDALYDICDAFQHARFRDIKDAATDERRHLLFLQERIRLHTHGVRNWGYFKQVLNVLHKLFTPLDPHCVRITGIRASDYIILFSKMLEEIERGMNQYTKKLAPAFAKTKNEEFIAEYHRQFGLDQSKGAELLRHAREQGWTRDALRSAVLSHSILHLLKAFEFPATQLSSWIGAADADVAKAMNLVSLKVGDLHDFKFEHLFLGNPVWEKPVIQERPAQYFCCLPQVFFAFAFHIFDRIFSSDAAADKAHTQRRSKFLQSEVEACFATAFGEQHVFPAVEWKLDGTRYESDLLITVDTHLFIIELKSNQISWPALRGAPERLKRHVQELLIDPAEQSGRLEEAIRRKLSGAPVDLNISPELFQGQINEITRLSVTLEDFATIQSDLKEIKACGFALTGAMPVTMSLSDLQTVLTILDNPIERIFYLHRRQRVQATVSYLGDEMDLLGLYLATGFDLGDSEKGERHIVAVGMSKKIDEYFQAVEQGIARPIPRRKMGKWFTDIISRLTERKIARWTEMALLLLSLRFEEQNEFEKSYARMRAKLVSQPPEAPDRENIVMLIPPEWRAIGFASVAFFEDEDRHQIIENAASHVFERSAATHCLVIARDIRDAHYPYATLAVFNRSKADRETSSRP